MPTDYNFEDGNTPFTQAPSENTFYSSPALQQRLNALILLQGGKEKLAFVLGESGSGKTLMMKQFMGMNPKSWSPCKINASTSEDSSLNSGNKTLSKYKAYINSEPKYPIIIIDNAEKLSEDDMIFLYNLTGCSGFTKKLQQVILFARPEIEKKIKNVSDRVNSLHLNKIYMPSLTQDETRIFIQKQINASSLKGETLFSDSDYKTIFKLSGGMPGKINIEANKLLFEASEDKTGKKSTFDKNIKAAAIIIGVLLVIAAILFLTLNNRGKIKSENIIENPKPKESILPEVENKKTAKEDIQSYNPAEEAETFQKAAGQDAQININTEKWILEQPEKSYTIQIIGTSSEEKLKTFIKENKLDESYAYFHTFRNDKDWFSLITGVFNSPSEAASARENLPENFKVYHPWVRKFKSIDKDIANGRYSED